MTRFRTWCLSNSTKSGFKLIHNSKWCQGCILNNCNNHYRTLSNSSSQTSSSKTQWLIKCQELWPSHQWEGLRVSNNSSCFRCSRWWQTWCSSRAKARTSSKWPCFSKCSRWSWWCRTWCPKAAALQVKLHRLSNTLSNRLNKRRSNRTPKTTCSLTCFSQPLYKTQWWVSRISQWCHSNNSSKHKIWEGPNSIHLRIRVMVLLWT